MRADLRGHNDETMPLELRLDLLVDGELGEQQRRELLLSLERGAAPDGWKQLAVRFLERQTEKETVRKLMAGGAVMPVKRVVIGRVGMRRLLATAAGLLIAVTSAAVTFYVARPINGAGELRTSLPADAVAADNSVPVSVPVVRAMDGSQFIPVRAPRATRTSVIVQPDGNGGAIVIPVNTVKAPVY